MRWLSAVIIVLLLGLLGWLFLRRESGLIPRRSGTREAKSAEASCPKLAPVPVKPPPELPPVKVRWLAVGAVDSPEANQVSIEQDVELMRSVLGPSGVVLLAGGPGSRDVQVQLGAAQKRGDALFLELADLLAPRGGRWSRYRLSHIARSGPATLPQVKRSLDRVLRAGGASLLVYLGGHGEAADTPQQSYVSLWGGERLTVQELAGWLDASSRPLQLVVTTCYGGTFAETLFRGADPRRGVAHQRCGFFATAPDLPASGCDPNPNRAGQEGYALHLFNALRWRDRNGHRLSANEVDLDGDGRISLAEAHGRARIDLDSVDVPATTSERWLRQAAPRSGPRARGLPLPEERAVAQILAKRVRLPAELKAVRVELAARERIIDAARKRFDQASSDEDRASRQVVAELLSRWPVLDDPWHPDFAALWRCQRRSIETYLRTSRSYAEYIEARDTAEDAEHRHWEFRRRAAPVERLVRALETIELAERLRARGGAAWQTYAAILACERTVP